MKNDKRTLTYKINKTVEYYPPHSKFLLRRNIFFCIFVFIISCLPIGIMFMMAKAIQIPTILNILINISFIGMFIFPAIDDTIKEWKNGKNLKWIISDIERNCTSEERDKLLKEIANEREKVSDI